MRVLKLGNVCSKIGSGATPKGGKNVYTETGTALIRSQNVHNLEFVWDGLARITDEAAKRLNNVKVKKGDVLLNITGDSVARVCLVPKFALPARVNQHVAIIRPDSNLLDSRFLALYLASPYMQSFMLNRAAGKGASRNALTKDMISSFEIPAPSLVVQETIAARLNIFNDLIENNRKQIKLLEEAAQRLFREWFIDLRFPGHETVSFDSETGLPEGWEEISIRSALEEEIGGGWGEEAPTPEFSEIAYVIRATDFNDAENGMLSNIPLRFHKPSNLASRSLRDGDIVFEVSGGSRDHGVGRNLRITEDLLTQLPHPVMCASFCKKMRPKSAPLSLIIAESIRYAYLSEGLRAYEKRSAGNIINFHWDEFLDNYILRIPPKGLLDTYIYMVEKIHKTKSVKANMTRVAREARDRLLPRLMENNNG